MKKNLKKVISAVLSLALVMSSLVAMTATSSAATFADVKDTASYAEAVNALSALGAISGYDDGTFLPDNNITRAEVTTMVVAALNMTDDANASGATTKFADVNANAAWAAGYVNVGVAKGFISGMSATEFAPSENVTYAQIVSMLTRILGYGDYAVARGGWPDGYILSGSTAGILSGVTAGANDAMTRAQVAQLIWNTVKAPMLDVTVFTANVADTELEKMDGKDNDYKNILKENFNAYVMDVEVANTSKTAPSLENDVVELKFTNKKDWNPKTETFVAAADKANANIGTTDVADYLFSSGKAVLEYNEDGEWTVLYFAPTNKVATKAVDGSLLNTATTDLDNNGNNVLAINKSKNTTSNPTKYDISASANVYVNGVLYDTLDGTNEADIEAVIAAADGDVVLYEDTTNTTGTKYNKIMVDIYAFAKVSQVQVKGDDVTIRFTAAPTIGATLAEENIGSGTSLTIVGEDVAEGDVIVSVTKNDEAIELTSLAKDDVVAIKGDITGGFATSKTLDIIATDATIAGKYTSYNSDDLLYRVAGVDYEVSDGAQSFSPTRGSTYTFTLDPFGKLFGYVEDVTSTVYGIVQKYISAADATDSIGTIEVVTMDGQKKVLYIDEDYETAADTVLGENGMKIKKTAKLNSTTPVKDRIISYTTKASNGRVNKVVKATDLLAVPDAEYNEAASTLGKRISTSAVVLDATDYLNSNYKASSLSALSASVDYDVVLLHKSNAAYVNVIITKAGSKYGISSDFAVAARAADINNADTNEDGDTIYQLRVATQDGTEILNIADDAVVYDRTTTSTGKAYNNGGAAYIKRATAFLYTTDVDGLVDRIDVVFEGGINKGDFATLYSMVAGTDWYVPVAGASVITVADWANTMKDTITGEDEIRVFLAPVVAANEGSVTFGKVVATGKYHLETDGANTETFAVTADSKIYSLDLSTRGYDNYQAFGGGAFVGLDLSLTADDAVGSAYFTGGTALDDADHDFTDTFQMAFVMTVNDVVASALVFNN